MTIPVKDVTEMRRRAAEVSALLEAIGNERRLQILCTLAEAGEATVGALAEAAGLSQSATSQHLARMREEQILAFRRESQTAWYHIADPRVEKLLESLHRIFCRPSKPKGVNSARSDHNA